MDNKDILKMAQSEASGHGEYESAVTKRAAGYGTVIGLIILTIMFFLEMLILKRYDFGKPAIVFAMSAVSNLYEACKLKIKRKIILGVIEAALALLFLLAYLGALLV